MHEGDLADDGGEEVAKIMGDAAGEQAERLQLSGAGGFVGAFALLGDVAEGEDGAGDAVGRADEGGDFGDQAFAAVGAEEAVGVDGAFLAGVFKEGEDGGFAGLAGAFVERGKEIGDGAAGGALAGPAEELLGGGVHQGDVTVGVGGDDGLADVVEGEFEALALFGEEAGRAAAPGDVGEDAEDADGAVVGVADDIGADEGGEGAAAFCFDVGFAAPGSAGADAGVDRGRDGLVGEEGTGLGQGVEFFDSVAEEGEVGAVVVDGVAFEVADADGVGGAFDRLLDAGESEVCFEEGATLMAPVLVKQNGEDGDEQPGDDVEENEHGTVAEGCVLLRGVQARPAHGAPIKAGRPAPPARTRAGFWWYRAWAKSV